MEENARRMRAKNQVKLYQIRVIAVYLVGSTCWMLLYDAISSKFKLAQTGLGHFVAVVLISLSLYMMNIIAQSASARVLYKTFSRKKQVCAYNKLLSQYHKLLDEIQRYHHAVEGAKAVHWEWDHSRKESLTVILDGMNQKENGNINWNWSRWVHQDDIQLLRSHFEKCMFENNQHFECEHRMKDLGGNYRWMITRGQSVLDHDKSKMKIVGMSFDITAKHTESVKLIEKVSRDSLTGLLNREAFSNRVREFIDSAEDTEKKAVLLFLDIDDFKAVNDNWGHDVGDAFLIETATRLKSCVRNKDSVARLGGDEFGILIDEIEQLDEIKHILGRIHSAFEIPFETSGRYDTFSISIGSAMLPDDGRTVEALMKCADMEMYRSKRQKKSNLNYLYKRVQSKAAWLKRKME